MLSVDRIFAITIKEFKQLVRDRITFAMIVMIPLVQLVLFGYAINTDVRNVQAGYVDDSGSATAAQLLQDIAASHVVQWRARYSSIAHAEQAIARGDVAAVLYLPADLNRRLLDRQQASDPLELVQQRPLGQWITDGSDPMLTGAIKGLRQFPVQLKGVALPTPPPMPFELVSYFNPEGRTAINIVPGLVAVILTMTMILFTSAAIVREREQGNMEFLINTPVRPLELMLGKIVPYMLVGFIQMAIILSLGHLVFGVPLPANVAALLVITLLFVLASLTLGLLISTRAQSQLQAMQMTVFVLLPSILLSGFMFPFDAMPAPAQWIAELLPATHYVRLSKAVILRDASWLDLVPDMAALGVFFVIGLVIATLRFKKRLD